MEALECIKTRRSVRKFKEDIIPDEVIRELVELASYSPSWKNTQTIRYISVSDPERSEERRVGKECRSRWSPYH